MRIKRGVFIGALALTLAVFSPAAHPPRSVHTLLAAEPSEIGTGTGEGAARSSGTPDSASPVPVEHSLFHSYYRDDVTIRSRLGASRAELADYILSAALVSAATDEILARRDSSPVDPEVTIRLRPSAMSPGRYRVRMRLLREGTIVDEQMLTFSRLRDRPVESLRVRPRGDMTLMVDGEPFFPLGIYETPPDRHTLNEYVGAGFNTVGVYERTGRGLKMILDGLHEAGLMAWVALGDMLDLSSEGERRKRSIRGIVDAVGSHPALLMWESVDEPAWGSRDADGLLAGYEYLRMLDPHHPVWTNHAPRNDVSVLAYYNRATDIAGCDIYPVPEPTDHTDLPNRTLSAVGDEVEKNLAAVNHEKPVIMALQGFAWRAIRRPDDREGVYPTLAQHRYMAYSAIVRGARGILYWGTRYTPKPSRAWTDIKTVAEELSSLLPVFAAGPGKLAPVVRSDARSVEAMLRFVEGEAFLICVNNVNRETRATVSGLPMNVGELRVVCGPDQMLKVEGGAADVALPGYGVVVATSDPGFSVGRPDYGDEPSVGARARGAEELVDDLADETRSRRNLLLNPSFELESGASSLPHGWRPRYPLTCELTRTGPRSGQLCVRLTSPDAGLSPLLVQRGVGVDAGEEYRLSAWLKTDGSGAECRVYAEWVVNRKFHTRATPWTRGAASWQRVHRRFTATPPPGGDLYVVLQMRGRGSAWFDDIVLERVDR